MTWGVEWNVCASCFNVVDGICSGVLQGRFILNKLSGRLCSFRFSGGTLKIMYNVYLLIQHHCLTNNSYISNVTLGTVRLSTMQDQILKSMTNQYKFGFLYIWVLQDLVWGFSHRAAVIPGSVFDFLVLSRTETNVVTRPRAGVGLDSKWHLGGQQTEASSSL